MGRSDRRRARPTAAAAHATPGLSADIDPIGFYVQVGAMADLAALRRWDLPRGYTGSAYRAHPANDLFGVVAAAISAEARPHLAAASPCCAGPDWRSW